MATETVPFVSVVVPARNARRTLADCLSSLLRIDYPVTRREILIIDNDSTDDTARIIREFPVIHLAEARRGPSHARNRGILASHGDLIAFTDADCVVTSRWLRALVAEFTSASIGGVAGEILAYPPHTWAEYYMARRRPRWQRTALEAVRPYAVTANVAFRRRVFDEIGLFDPRLITGQDQDFSWRFLRAGLGLRYAPGAVVFHHHRAGPWTFFRQQLGWAHGAALLRKYHGVPWGFGAELAEYRRLWQALAVLLNAVACAPSAGLERTELYYRLYDVLRELAWRLMSVTDAVSGVARRASGLRGPAAARRQSLVATPDVPSSCQRRA